MCGQCMIGAATAAAGATGVRAWLAAHRSAWMTAARLRAFSALTVATAVTVAGVRV